MSTEQTSGSRKGRPWSTDIPWLFLPAILLGALAAVATALLLLSRFGRGLPGLLQQALVQTALVTTVLLLFTIVPPWGKLSGKLGLRRLRAGDVCIVFLGLILIYAWQIFSLPLWERILNRLGGKFPMRQELLNECSRSTPMQFVFMLALAGVLIPFIEEVVFRRLIYGTLRPLGVAAAVILTALIFAAAHGFLYGLPALFGLGVIFELQYLFTGNLMTSTLTHMIYNLISLTMTFLMGRL